MMGNETTINLVLRITEMKAAYDMQERTGTIISIDKKDQKGIIVDVNEQEIPFYAIPKNWNLKINDQVVFDIVLGISGLSAVITNL